MQFFAQWLWNDDPAGFIDYEASLHSGMRVWAHPAGETILSTLE
jgi:hypothetical protein